MVAEPNIQLVCSILAVICWLPFNGIALFPKRCVMAYPVLMILSLFPRMSTLTPQTDYFLFIFLFFQEARFCVLKY